MTFRHARGFLYLAVDIVLLALCTLHIPSLTERARAPFRAESSNGRVIVHDILDNKAAPELRPGDQLLGWNNSPIPHPSVIEFLAERATVGSTVFIRWARGERETVTPVTLIPFSSFPGVAAMALIGLLTWAIAVFVLFARRDDRTAKVLHWSLISMAVVVVMSFEGVTPGSVLGYGSSLLFFLSYGSLMASFLLFTFLFPRPWPGSFWSRVLLVCSPVMILTAATTAAHRHAIVTGLPEAFAAYRTWFSWFHVALLLYVGLGIASIVARYRSAESAEERAKIRWILWGLCAGPTPFLLLNALPQVLGIPEVFPEEYTLVFLLLIPATFAIAFVRYRLLDIEVVISRTTAYALVLGALLALYTGLVWATAAWIGTPSTLTSALTAIAVALLSEPIRRLVQSMVDRLFFRVRYNYRLAQRRCFERLKAAFTEGEVAAAVTEEADLAIPVERIGFFTLRQPGNRLTPLTQQGFDPAAHHSVRFDVEHLKTDLGLPVGRTGLMEPGSGFESADDAVFARWGMALVFPLLSGTREVTGFLVLGPKRSGRRFSAEDVDLLGSMAMEAGLRCERIRLNHRLVLEHAEALRLAELNEMKSDFVSYVSHELRTPLTSIKMFTELLRARGRKVDKQGLGFLQIIEGEADRLNRMVGTILDSARIDRGVMEYRQAPANLVAIARQVLETMAYQLTTQGFRVEFRGGRGRIPIYADEDAVAQAIMNLVANSIKYSAARKYLKISVLRRDGQALCRVQDRGVGIPHEALPKLFQKFYRVADHQGHARGVGLGLPLVKHIMDAHGGTVSVESTPGRGSMFTLAFPSPSSYHSPEEVSS
jgi:signal transduction histidine kinase